MGNPGYDYGAEGGSSVSQMLQEGQKSSLQIPSRNTRPEIQREAKPSGDQSGMLQSRKDKGQDLLQRWECHQKHQDQGAREAQR
ncbi:hypothetical protein ACFX1R_006465 [Malus domestica]